MLKIDKTINTAKVEGLQVIKWISNELFEVMLILLEKDHTFPEHTSPKKVSLIVLEGDIQFTIQSQVFNLVTNDKFSFPANEKHSVIALEDSKFILIR